MPDSYIPPQYLTSIPYYEPQDASEHRANWVAFERWMREFPYPSMGSVLVPPDGITAGNTVSLYNDSVTIPRFNAVHVVVILTGTIVTADTGSGNLTVTLRIDTPSPGTRTRIYDFDAEGTNLSQPIAITAEAISTVPSKTVPVEVEASASGIDFVAGADLVWFILPAPE